MEPNRTKEDVDSMRRELANAEDKVCAVCALSMRTRNRRGGERKRAGAVVTRGRGGTVAAAARPLGSLSHRAARVRRRTRAAAAKPALW